MKTIDRQVIYEVVRQSMRDVLVHMGKRDLQEEISESTSLFEPEGVLDSMGLVTLIIDVEQRLNESYDLDLSIADDRAMSQKNSPFRTVKTLTDYVYSLLES